MKKKVRKKPAIKPEYELMQIASKKKREAERQPASRSPSDSSAESFSVRLRQMEVKRICRKI